MPYKSILEVTLWVHYANDLTKIYFIHDPTNPFYQSHYSFLHKFNSSMTPPIHSKSRIYKSPPSVTSPIHSKSQIYQSPPSVTSPIYCISLSHQWTHQLTLSLILPIHSIVDFTNLFRHWYSESSLSMIWQIHLIYDLTNLFHQWSH